MSRWQGISLLALLGALDSIYLLLHKLGYIGSLACTTAGACDVVNTSEYSSLLGFPVAGYGLAGYLLILGLAVYGTGRDPDDRSLDRLLAAVAGAGAAFSIYLTYVSLAVIGTACPWCLVSLGIILAIFALSLRGAIARPAGSAAPSASADC